jgi:hypothetical protein
MTGNRRIKKCVSTVRITGAKKRYVLRLKKVATLASFGKVL